MCSKKKFIEDITKLNSNISYNESEGALEVVKQNLTSHDYTRLYQGVIEFLEENRAPQGVFKYAKVVDINLGYYSGCLLRYSVDLLDHGLHHADSCWGKYCEKTVELGYKDDHNQTTTEFLKEQGEVHGGLFLQLLTALNNGVIREENFHVSHGWVKFVGPDIVVLFGSQMKRLRKYAREKIKGPEDRVIRLIKTIAKHGWKPELAYGGNTGVLGYSSVDKQFMVFHGKHRLVALKYLIQKNVLPNDLLIEYPIINFSFPNWRQNVPLLTRPQCKNCGTLG